MSATKQGRGDDKADVASITKSVKKMELGVTKRTPMGEYIPGPAGPLSSLAIPLPGPLDYDPKLQSSGVQYSILGKHAPNKLEEITIGPGPNQYNISDVKETFSHSPHWSFGMKLNGTMKVKDDNPSPFAYNNNHKTFGNDGYSYTMSGWFPSTITETPGPDRYFPDPKTHPIAGNSPKWSFGLKPETKEETTPGPQDYEVSSMPLYTPCAPSYTIGSRLGSQFASKEDSQNPGCNAYNVKLPPSSKAASLKGWYKESKALKTPGPANYIMPNTLFSGPQYSLTARNIPYEDDEEYVTTRLPGPTDYNPNPKPTLDRSPMYSLGSRWKDVTSKRIDGPGPRTYYPKDRQIRGNDGPKVTLKGRYTTKIGSTPGPADYNTSTVTTSMSVAQLARLEKKRDIPQSSRSVEKTPGPADYDPKPVAVTKTSGPKYSLASRLADRKADQTPGPNAYRAAPRFDGARISMKSRMSPFVLVFPSQRVDTLRH